ncbi:cell division protein FtsX [Williamwhitmania taraxaci]|uniref:Cell division protein FtsX n=1 Tax=Williamwhitmania taraxaci TaxID=1640674 RepID=A0A1G6NZ56_9BACT|nr:permease-like cell division protein FtsX [Williamwhitmania taraxaci]SDC73069.1 cell division transport system permease protein [Williamwhitmania taraxaci]
MSTTDIRQGQAKRSLRSSFISSIISIALVLFTLGVVGLLAMHAKRLSDFVKENISFSVLLKEDVNETDAAVLLKALNSSQYVKSTTFISKEEAANIMREQLGQDFVEFLGNNPLSASLEVRLKADYANSDSIVAIEKEIKTFNQVKEINYQKNLIDLVNENVRQISMTILSFSALLLFLALVLINNTIRLSVYARRFLINTMKLVGATYGFIRKPFLVRSIAHGLYAGIIADLLLLALIWFGQEQVKQILEITDIAMLSILLGSVLILGITISYVSTFFAVQKFLRLKADDLYY